MVSDAGSFRCALAMARLRISFSHRRVQKTFYVYRIRRRAHVLRGPSSRPLRSNLVCSLNFCCNRDRVPECNLFVIWFVFSWILGQNGPVRISYILLDRRTHLAHEFTRTWILPDRRAQALGLCFRGSNKAAVSSSRFLALA